MPNPHQPELPALLAAGSMLANCAYNLAQSDRLTDAQRRSLDESRKAWDKAFPAVREAHAASRPADGVPASVKQKWPQRLGYPMPDENGNETGDIGELAYADGWNACLVEAKRMSGVEMPLKGKKGVVVEDASAPTSTQAGDASLPKLGGDQRMNWTPHVLHDVAAWHRRMNQELSGKGDEWAAREMWNCPHGRFATNLEVLCAQAAKEAESPTPDAAARARELLADAYRTIGYEQTAQKVLDGEWDSHPSMFALEQALTQPLTTPSDAGGEPVGYVLYEQQSTMTLFDGADETDGLWFWNRRQDAQAAADRLHKSHGFPNDYWHVTPLYPTPPNPGDARLDELKSACEPFIRHNSSEQFIDLRVPTSAITKLRSLLDGKGVGA